MIDDIFKIRFIEEVARIANAREQKTRRRLGVTALLTFILAFGSTAGMIDLIIDAVRNPAKTFYVHYIVIFILFGFSITFLLTLLLFVMAYAKNAKIKRCLRSFKFSVDNNKVTRGEEIELTLGYKLLKRELKDVKMTIECESEKKQVVLDVSSVKKDYPYKENILLGESLKPADEPYLFTRQVNIPADAPISKEFAVDDNEKVTWMVTVYFEFANWYSYQESIPLQVV